MSKTASFAWRYPAPKRPELQSSDVHVWRASLERNRPCVQSLKRILSEDERAKAERLHCEQDRERFIVARGVLRVILSRYLGTEPSQLRFCYSPHGKPDLDNTSAEKTLSFNMSHSGGLALYAVTRDQKVGIDLERIHADLAYESIAERFFSPREKAVLHGLQTDQVKLSAFFNGWTRKEAYIKARGEGLSFPLDQFDVSLAPGEPASLLEVRGNSSDASCWSLHELCPGPGYAAALAVEGQGCRLACWEWQE